SSVAITSLRKRARRRHEVPLGNEEWQDWPAPASGDPGAELDRRQLAERLDSALLTLPAGYRAVVVMRDVYGFSLEEVGNQLGISEGAAKVRLHRARQKLREMLVDEAPPRSRAMRERLTAPRLAAAGGAAILLAGLATGAVLIRGRRRRRLVGTLRAAAAHA